MGNINIVACYSRRVLLGAICAVVMLSLAAPFVAHKSRVAADSLPAGTYCGDTAPTDGTYQGPTKFVVIEGENEPYHQALSSSVAPFQANTLNSQCGYMSNIHNESHGSESNYHALVSGQYANWALCDFPPDDNGAHTCPQGPVTDYGSTPSIMSQLEVNYGTNSWKIYAESMVSNCQKGDAGGPYAVRHNPAPYFPNIACATQNVPYTAITSDLANNQLPQFSMIIPDDNDNGHDTGVANFDSFLGSTMSQLQATADYQSGKLAVIVTYDEGTARQSDTAPRGEDCTAPNQGDSLGSCQVDSWVVGRYVPHTTWGQFSTHYTLLKSMESALGLGYLGHAGDASTVDFYHDTNPFNLNPNLTPPPPPTVPAAPTNVTATPGNTTAAISFTPAGNGGSPVTGYTVTSSPGNVVATGAASPITVTGLTNGNSYSFTVTATNSIGSSAASVPSNTVTPTSNPELLPDPGFEAGAGGWVNFSKGVAARVTSPVHSGGFAMKVASTLGTANSSGITQNSVVNNSVAGQTYNFQCYVTATGSGLKARIRLYEYAQNFSSGTILQDIQTTTAVSTTGWQLLQVSAPAVTSGDRIVPQLYSNNETTATGSLVYDDCSVTSGSVPQATAPAAPTAVTATAGNGQATVSFTPPTSNGGSAITGYTVSSSPGNVVASGSGSPITVTGLTNGTSYTFTVTATNVIGTGPSSAPSNSVTPVAPVTAPSAPLAVAAVAGNGLATVSFSPPVSNGGSPITGYTVTSSPGNIVATGSSSPITLTSLANGTSYTFTVTATNSVGTSVASTPSSSVIPSAPATVPDAPTTITATAGDGQAIVSFLPPANNGGSPITGYTVSSSPGNAVATGTTSPVLVTGLTNGTSYTFTVTATNGVGTGVASAVSNTVTPAAPVINPPDAPTNVTAIAGNGQATVSFTPPANNGGAPITSYTVTSSPGNIVATGSGSPITVSGLANGTSYSFAVTATNSAGPGAASAVSNAVTPTGVRNLLTNGDIEAGISNYKVYSATSLLSLNTTTVHGGTKAIQVGNNTVVTAGFNAPTIAGSQITVGLPLTATCWVRASAVNYQARLRLSEGTGYTLLAETISPKLLSGVWTQVSVTATVQRTGDQIVMSGYTNNQVLGGPGLIWDDCTVTTPI